ncbi:hypothetical protein BLAT2472_100035 [Burkholderia latens]
MDESMLAAGNVHAYGTNLNL